MLIYMAYQCIHDTAQFAHNQKLIVFMINHVLKEVIPNSFLPSYKVNTLTLEWMEPILP